eukprot:352965-Chlamydomonas_euryale.AAC.8
MEGAGDTFSASCPAQPLGVLESAFENLFVCMLARVCIYVNILSVWSRLSKRQRAIEIGYCNGVSADKDATQKTKLQQTTWTSLFWIFH